ncbi:MAG TPA: prephenate dehydratase domain-containing protein [Myxococcaceae bacterium]|nr:prephenate dehydratase domain-containing protein [Myxococcaceae bacterium]
MKVAYAGEPGAFGEEAARMLPDAEPISCPSFAAVFDAVSAGAAERGVVPLHNSRAGMVEEVVRLLARSPLQVADRLALRVRQNLLALPGVRLEEIRRVASHPQALAQCSKLIQRNGWELVARSATSSAARQLSEEKDRTSAVIASTSAARLYGLSVLAAGVEDDPENITRFVVLRALAG